VENKRGGLIVLIIIIILACAFFFGFLTFSSVDLNALFASGEEICWERCKEAGFDYFYGEGSNWRIRDSCYCKTLGEVDKT